MHQLIHLEKIDDAPEAGYRLIFRPRQSRDEKLGPAQILHGKLPCKEVRAKIVILAMPKHSLERLDQDCLLFYNEQFLEGLRSVSEGHAFKFFLAYASKWWSTVGQTRGASKTDLAVRSVFYWPDARPGNGAVVTNADGAKMATGSGVLCGYNISGFNNFLWSGIQGGEPFCGTRSTESPRQAREWKKEPTGAGLNVERNPEVAGTGTFFFYDNEVLRQCSRDGEIDADLAERLMSPLGPTASKLMVRLAHDQFKEVHGVDEAPSPLDAAFCDWTGGPIGACFYYWRCGARHETISEQMIQPLDGENIFIVGECWSLQQAFVEGALQTSETMLQKKLGLPRPAWLRNDAKPVFKRPCC